MYKYFFFFFLQKNSSVHIWQTFNALFIIRCTVKYLIETGSEYQLLQHFEAIPTLIPAEIAKNDTAQINVEDTTTSQAQVVRPVDGSKFESFFDAVVNLLIIIPVK